MMHESIHSKNAPKAVGPYSPAVRIGDFIFLSGQLPIDPSTGKLVEGGIREQTAQCLKNMQALLAEVGIDLSFVLKTTVYLKNMDDFKDMNEVYGTFFQEPYPARCAAEVSKLAMDALVEIEAYAIDTRALEVVCKHGDEECDETCCCCKDDKVS